MSLTRLRRRWLRWDRYAAQVAGNFSPGAFGGRSRSGYWRALEDLQAELERREVRTVYWPTASMPDISPGGKP